MVFAAPDVPTFREAIASPLPFFFLLGIVVFIHELGHFLAARWCGIRVVAFSLGFGPEVWGFNDRHGTRWKLSWLPLGGYVSFPDDANPASKPSQDALAKMTPQEREEAFHTKALWQKAMVIAAGPIFNFILAIGIFAVLYSTYGKVQIPARVLAVVEGGAAEKAGFKPGDLITELSGQPIESFTDLKRIVGGSTGRELIARVERDGGPVVLRVTPILREAEDGFGRKMMEPQIGIRADNNKDLVRTKQFGPFAAVVEGVRDCYYIGAQTLGYLGDVVTGRRPPDQLGGPGRIADTAKKVADLGFVALISLAALISVSIGLLNLFPIPPLDGGHLMFYAFEAIRGKAPSARAQEFVFSAGLMVVLSLFLFANWNDRSIFSGWFQQLGRMVGVSS